MSYYISFLEELKQKFDVTINSEVSKDSTHYVDLTINAKDIVLCSSCASSNIIKFGMKDRAVRDDYLSNRITIIHLHYNRFKCKDCGKMFVQVIPTLNAKQSLSMPLKLNILEDLKQDQSFTTIAKKRNVSIQTVIDIFEGYVSFDRISFGEVLCMDEFKNLKHSKDKYAFVMFDPNAHTINDVLENRIQETIDNYLYKIDWHEKEKVKYVVTDMSESYRTIIKRHFRAATHIIDCFHYLRYVEDAFNNVRIRIQGLYKETSPKYKILKRYWRILSAYYIDVEGESIYNPIMKKNTTVQQLLNDAMSVHPDIEKAYSITQFFLKNIRELKYENSQEWFKEWIKMLEESELKEFIKLKDMFLNWKNEILNSFIRFGDKRLHNGYLEGMNNKIKVIKRISYGYSNFSHFRNRIMYMVNSNYSIKIVDKTKIIRKPRKKNEK